ncbi:MAG: hypothetical protein HYR96_03500 [Deltaproteobacteria bacterium]|nr:hypothetical protein [Deltaproteobacteria bacterium]MBI3295182.1 hypothetical protein [Deltaproteobacteria bacterium]
MIFKKIVAGLTIAGVTLALFAVVGEFVTRFWILKIAPPGFVIHSTERPFFQMAGSIPYRSDSHFWIRRPVKDRGHRPKKVAFIGDSVTYGINLADHETISEALQKMSTTWDTYNFGTPGFGIPEVQWAIDDLGSHGGFDAIVYVFNPNDLYDAMPVLLSLLRNPSERFASYEAYASQWGVFKSLAKDYFKFPFAFYYYWTMRHVAGPFYQASQKLFRFDASVGSPSAGGVAPAPAPPPSSHSEQCVYSPMVPPAENDHYTRTYSVAGKMLHNPLILSRLKEALSLMSETAHRYGVHFSIAAFYDKVYPDYKDSTLRDVLASVVRPDEWIETFPTFLNHREDCGFYISDTAHLAPRGTKLFAQDVMHYLDSTR